MTVRFTYKVGIDAPSLMFGDEEEENVVEVKIGVGGFRLIQNEVDEDTQNPHSALGNLLTYALTTDVEVHAIEHISLIGNVSRAWNGLSQIHAKINLNERGLFAVTQVSGLTLKDDGTVLIETAAHKKERLLWEKGMQDAAERMRQLEAEQRARERLDRMELQQARRPKRQSRMDRHKDGYFAPSDKIDQPWDSTIDVMRKQHSKKKGGRRKR